MPFIGGVAAAVGQGQSWMDSSSLSQPRVANWCKTFFWAETPPRQHTGANLTFSSKKRQYLAIAAKSLKKFSRGKNDSPRVSKVALLVTIKVRIF